MVWNAARLLSPLLLGGLYALLVEVGKPEMLFLIAGVSGLLQSDQYCSCSRHAVLLERCYWLPWSSSEDVIILDAPTSLPCNQLATPRSEILTCHGVFEHSDSGRRLLRDFS